MREIMSEEVGKLRYRSQGEIRMPLEIRLDGDMLLWEERHTRYASDELVERDDQFSYRPTAGCLQEFVALAGAGPEAVLAFTMRRGVLGMFPLVGVRFSNSNPSAHVTHQWYKEPVSYYQDLASRFAAVLRVMGSLKTGVQVDEQDMIACVPPGWAPDFKGGGAGVAYHALCLLVSDCWRFADTKMQLSGLGATKTGLSLESPPEVLIWFGDWGDGKSWDFERGWLSRPGDMVAAPAERVARLSGAGAVRQEQALLEAGYSRSPSGEWFMSYRDQVADFADSPHGGRPSALYNLLAFQMLKEISLPEGSLFCGQCNGLYTYDADRARRPNKGEDAKEWGMSKPRQGRPKSFCSHFCRMQHDAADNKERYQNKKGR